MTTKSRHAEPAPSKYAPTHAGLWLARHDLDHLRAAAGHLRGANMLPDTSTTVVLAANKLAAEVITIPIRCLACKVTDVPVEFTVGDPERAEPDTAVCGRCAAGAKP
jgi:hypothetical protein